MLKPVSILLSLLLLYHGASAPPIHAEGTVPIPVQGNSHPNSESSLVTQVNSTADADSATRTLQQRAKQRTENSNKTSSNAASKKQQTEKQPKTKQNSQVKLKSPTNSPTKVNPTRESVAMAFAQSHHPELVKLLLHLKSKRNAEYQKAITHIYQASERLGRLSDRNLERYQLQLEMWKLDSRIRLVAARLKMSPSTEIEQELETLLSKQVELRIALYTMEKKRLEARLSKVNEIIDQIEQDPQVLVRKDLERIKRSLRLIPSQAKPTSKKPATKKVANPGNKKQPSSQSASRTGTVGSSAGEKTIQSKP